MRTARKRLPLYSVTPSRDTPKRCTVTVVPAHGTDQLALDLPALAVTPATHPPRPRTRPARPAPPSPGLVWSVWDGDDLAGLYATEDAARTDAATLRRDAARARCRPVIECVPVPVFTGPQHGGRRG